MQEEKKVLSAREQAIDAINGGNSVIIPVEGFPQGKQFSRENLADLPSEAEFAMLQPGGTAKTDALAKVRAEMESLKRMEAMLVDESNKTVKPAVNTSEEEAPKVVEKAKVTNPKESNKEDK